MSIPVSAVKATKAYMVTALAAALTPDLVSAKLELGVFYDDPGTSEPVDMVVVGHARRAVEVSAYVGGQGAGAFQDTWLQDVVVSVVRASAVKSTLAAQAAWERAADLCDQIITWQRTDPTLGGRLILSRPQDIDMPPAQLTANETGYVAEHTVSFFCRATY